MKFVRHVLLEVLNLVTVIEVNNEELRKGICDESFTDLEDSFQHQTALFGQCEAIVTLNVKDFKGVDTRQINVYTPKQFVDFVQN